MEAEFRIIENCRDREFHFAAGVLHTNDVDCQVAGALADQVITEKPFESISQDLMIRLWN